MTNIDIFILIVAIIGWSTAIAITRECYIWRKKYEVFKASYYTELEMKDANLAELENELKTYKDMERVIKVEKVIMQPRELECKFMLHERFVDDSELFKKVITSEVARYMAEELNKDPYLCKIYHDRNNYAWREDIKVRFRLLPYAEGVVWDDIFKEEK